MFHQSANNTAWVGPLLVTATGCSRWVAVCNNYDLRDYVPFLCPGAAGIQRIGLIDQRSVDVLTDYPDVFDIDAQGVSVNPIFKTEPERSKAVSVVVRDLASQGLIARTYGEPCPVFDRDVLTDQAAKKSGDSRLDFRCLPDFRGDPLLVVDRGAAQFFGVPVWGVHLNGYTETFDGSISGIWVARRGKDCAVNPGRLDSTVAGGQPWGLSFRANLAKEAWEEASISEFWTSKARPVSVISYCIAAPEGLSPAVMACYDLSLPVTFHPLCSDTEIQSFHRWSPDAVLNHIATCDGPDAFKPNANLCALDFLLRHKIFVPDQAELDILHAGGVGLRTLEGLELRAPLSSKL